MFMATQEAHTGSHRPRKVHGTLGLQFRDTVVWRGLLKIDGHGSDLPACCALGNISAQCNIKIKISVWERSIVGKSYRDYLEPNRGSD